MASSTSRSASTWHRSRLRSGRTTSSSILSPRRSSRRRCIANVSTRPPCAAASTSSECLMFASLKRTGLSWKVQLAPLLLIVMLLALGAYALLTLRDNQVKLDALMAGPVRQAELAADLDSTIWAAHAKLYRLAATAANES